MPSRGFILGYAIHNRWERCPSNGPSVEQPIKPLDQARRTSSRLQITVALSVSGPPLFPPSTEDENLCGFLCLDDDVQLENEVAPCFLSFSMEHRLSISLDRHFYGRVNDLTVSLAAVRLCPQRSELTK